MKYVFADTVWRNNAGLSCGVHGEDTCRILQPGESSEEGVSQFIQTMEGNYGYDSGSLDFSCTKIELTLQQGECCEGSFGIEVRGGRALGQVGSSDPRMECLTRELSGGDEEIAFCFHGEQLQAGQVVRGSFYIVSSLGEYSLPYVVTVSGSAPQSPMGPVKNLFHFANLAKENWEEAVALFYAPDFADILVGNDSQYYTLYRWPPCPPIRAMRTMWMRF